MLQCQLTLDILSGRENPTVFITRTTCQEILNWIDSLESIGEMSLYNGLGFRGFILRDNTATVYIQKCIVRADIDNSKSIYKLPSQEFLESIFQTFESKCQKGEYSNLINIAKNEYSICD